MVMDAGARIVRAAVRIAAGLVDVTGRDGKFAGPADREMPMMRVPGYDPFVKARGGVWIASPHEYGEALPPIEVAIGPDGGYRIRMLDGDGTADLGYSPCGQDSVVGLSEELARIGAAIAPLLVLLRTEKGDREMDEMLKSGEAGGGGDEDSGDDDGPPGDDMFK